MPYELRGYYTPTGEPESPNLVDGRYNSAREMLESKIREIPADTRTKEIINLVNFDFIEQGYKELWKKCNITPDSKIIRPEGIYCIEGSPNSTQFHPIENAITLASRTIAYTKNTTGLSRKAVVLYTLMHEETHASSRIIEKDLGIDLEDGSQNYVFTSGFNENRLKKLRSGEVSVTSQLLNSFMEGINDKIGRQQVKAYIESYPNFLEGPDKDLLISLIDKNIKLPRSSEIRMVDITVEFLARYTELPVQTVWQAIIRGHIEGTGFGDQETTQAVIEAIGPDTFSKLLQARQPKESENASNSMRDSLKALVEKAKNENKISKKITQSGFDRLLYHNS